jgi:hypothetical protein
MKPATITAPAHWTSVTPTSPYSAEESQALAAALANDDQARVVAILERHATLDYPENKGFDAYGDQFGFHFDAVDKLDVTWH